MSLPTIELEYIPTKSCFTQMIQMKYTHRDIKVVYDEEISIIYDNKISINISKKLVMHSRTKHISIWYHFLMDMVIDNKLRLEDVPTKYQIVDIFTRALPILLSIFGISQGSFPLLQTRCIRVVYIYKGRLILYLLFPRLMWLLLSRGVKKVVVSGKNKYIADMTYP